eukprot:gene26818-29467_t
MSVLQKIDRYLKASAMPPTTFGRLAVRDPRLVRDLRRGREPGPRMVPGGAMSRGPDAATLLKRALERHADAAGCDVALEMLEMTRWASATFAGARHRISLTLRDDPLGERWLNGLGDADLPISGQLVADLATVAVTRRDGMLVAALEALTVATLASVPSLASSEAGAESRRPTTRSSRASRAWIVSDGSPNASADRSGR